MAPQSTDRKRKALAKESESEDELSGNLDLEGVLSESEDDLDFEPADGEDDSEEADSEEVDDDEEDDDAADDDDLLSDDIPSDVDEEEAIQRLLDTKDEHDALRLTPEIVEPGVDPKPQDTEEDDGANYRVVKDANGGLRYVYDEIDPVYDSDDSDVQQPENTIGDIPLSYYDSYPHIGYDINGKKIMRPATKESLDALLESIEIPEGFTGLTDPNTGNPLNLSRDELELISRVQRGLIPDEGYDPYPDMVEYFTNTVEVMRTLTHISLPILVVSGTHAFGLLALTRILYSSQRGPRAQGAILALQARSQADHEACPCHQRRKDTSVQASRGAGEGGAGERRDLFRYLAGRRGQGPPRHAYSGAETSSSRLRSLIQSSS